MWNDATLTTLYGTFTSGGKTPAQLAFEAGLTRLANATCCRGGGPPLKMTLASPFFLPIQSLSSGFLATDYTRHAGATPGATYRVLVVNANGDPVYDAGVILNASGASGFGFEGAVDWITTGSLAVSGRINIAKLRADVIAPTPARLVTSMTGANNDLFVQAKTGGAAGNSLTLKLTNAGGTQTLAVTVSGNDVDVRLATTTGTITSTASDVIAAIKASTAASALISAALKGSDTGAGVVTALAKTNLAGGQDSPPDRVALRSQPLWLVFVNWNGTAIGLNWSAE